MEGCTCVCIGAHYLYVDLKVWDYESKHFHALCVLGLDVIKGIASGVMGQQLHLGLCV